MNDKRIFWSRGFLRLWVVLSLIWVLIFGAIVMAGVDVGKRMMCADGSSVITDNWRVRAISEDGNEIVWAKDVCQKIRNQKIIGKIKIIFLPPVILLLGVLLLSKMTMWVYSGFKRKG